MLANNFALTVADMRECDRKTIESKVSEIDLVARVAQKLRECILTRVKPNKSERIAMVCGKGNNGADGYALALLLAESGYIVDIYADESKSETCRHYRELCERQVGVNVRSLDRLRDIEPYVIVIDCLFGVGFSGEVRSNYIGVIEWINSCAYVIACDIPSGLDGDNGRVANVCVRASLTIAVQAVKVGEILADGREYCGELMSVDVGIDTDCEHIHIVGDNHIIQAFPPRHSNTHKSSYGSVGIVACSDHSIGAGVFATSSSMATSSVLDNANDNAECAMRAGAGLCKLFVPESILPQMLYRITNAMVDRFESLADSKVSSVAFGMGVGAECDMLQCVLAKGVPTVIDADGINILAKDLSVLKDRENIVLTPHPLEFSRLCGASVDEILTNPIDIAKNFARKHKVVLLLKGNSSIITDGDRVAVNIAGSPSMAKGGSGDILSGVIASLLGRKISPFEATCAGSYICGRAGESMAQEYGEYGALASDMPKYIAKTIYNIIKH